jgi:hypothetical protein
METATVSLPLSIVANECFGAHAADAAFENAAKPIIKIAVDSRLTLFLESMAFPLRLVVT